MLAFIDDYIRELSEELPTLSQWMPLDLLRELGNCEAGG